MEKAQKQSNVNLFNWLYLLIISGLVVAAYWDVFQWMYVRYTGEDSYYSHGFLIPFVSVYLIWLKRDKLQELTPQSDSLGFILVGLAVLTHVFGTAAYIFSISGFSLWILVMGISLSLYGREITKSIIFPLCFLLFMFPLPLAIITMISFPLKVLVAQVGVKIASMMGIPLLLEGFVITIPQGDLLVGNPCSGLRSLIAFLAMGALFAYFSYMSNIKKMILFFMAIPIAIISNLIRVPILIYCSYKWGLESAAPDTMVHTGSGFVVFILGIVLLIGAHRVLGATYGK